MFKCRACAQPHNVYDSHCPACGAPLPKYDSVQAAAPAAQPLQKTSCTTCGHNRFVMFTPFKAYNQSNGHGHPMPVVVEDTQRSMPVAGGSFRAQVCLRCGLAEWYATVPAELEALAETTSNMRVVEFPPPPHPYRG